MRTIFLGMKSDFLYVLIHVPDFSRIYDVSQTKYLNKISFLEFR